MILIINEDNYVWLYLHIIIEAFWFFNSDEVKALANFANLDDENLKLLKKWTSRDKIVKLRSTFVGQINAEKSDVFDFSSYEDMIEPKENWDS